MIGCGSRGFASPCHRGSSRITTAWPPCSRARADLNLLASSRVFSSPLPEIHDNLVVTGFWFEDGRDPGRWQPTPALRAFVQGGDRPLVLCLGGSPGPEAAEVVRIHAQAACLLGKTLVVQAGWAGLRDLSPPGTVARDRVFLTDFVSHDWLFARAEAVVHPGGIGVTARALKHGCPMLLEPRRTDHFFHAALVRELGVGYAMDPRKLGADGVARMLAERVAAPETRSRARACAESLRRGRGEDGLRLHRGAARGRWPRVSDELNVPTAVRSGHTPL